ncbi:VOC family protein [Acuticoccus sp. MNP-M23]|uniref:VOC family protein n=1 Tax=Acuticoccus sp. MNP-M23 TaxID=3072793 RepID=UPI002814EE31|nr:VOC family protein [Acuticoccus sp. MNP-M23]WMS44348.1 VOC family protein [Acuticoccus sp. MNP-M23]
MARGSGLAPTGRRARPASRAETGPPPMIPAIHRIVIYTKKMPEMAAFYGNAFGYEAIHRADDRIVELCPPAGGLTLLLHPAGKGQREGQALVKLVFDTPDVETARDALIARGIEVGPLHDGGGYRFANLKDPSGNSVSLSSRAFADRPPS